MKIATKLVCVILTVFTIGSVVLFSAETAENVDEPIQLEITLDKTKYFVSNNVKAAVSIRNVGEKDLQNLIVCIHSDKHQLLFGNQSVFEIAELKSTKSESCYLEMALKKDTPGLSWFSRLVLFFVQLHKNYIPFSDVCEYDKASVSKAVQIKQGNIYANLSVTVWYDIKEDSTYTPDDPDNPDTPDNPDYPPRPEVTYLDKYVVDILAGGSYTAKMEMTEDGMTMQFITYVDGDDWASEIPIGSMMAQEMGLPSSVGVGTLRFIIKDTKSNPKAYVVMPAGGYIEISDNTKIAEIINKVDENDLSRQMQFEKLRYFGRTTGVGYVCETYILPEENIRHDFYFAQTDDYTGLVRWDVSDLDSGTLQERVVMRLYKGVTNKKAFTVSGQQLSYEELETRYGITINDLYALFG